MFSHSWHFEPGRERVAVRVDAGVSDFPPRPLEVTLIADLFPGRPRNQQAPGPAVLLQIPGHIHIPGCHLGQVFGVVEKDSSAMDAHAHIQVTAQG